MSHQTTFHRNEKEAICTCIWMQRVFPANGPHGKARFDYIEQIQQGPGRYLILNYAAIKFIITVKAHFELYKFWIYYISSRANFRYLASHL